MRILCAQILLSGLIAFNRAGATPVDAGDSPVYPRKCAPASKCSASAHLGCKQDNCLRAVEACSHGPGPSSARRDCSSRVTTIVTGSAEVVTFTTTSTVTATPGPLVCYQDNCVRAFERFSSSAEAFCATYTTTINTGTYFPSFATNCPTAASALSSGCSCLASINAATTTTDTVTSFTTVATDTITDVATAYSTVTVQTTVTDTSTVRATVEGVSTLQEMGPTVVVKRGTPASIPTYASACHDAAQYASACSCVGAESTHSIPGTTRTTTVTRTATVTAPRGSMTFIPQTTITETATTVVSITVTTETTVTSTIDETAVQTSSVPATTVTVTDYTSTFTVGITEGTPECDSFYLDSSGPVFAGRGLGSVSGYVLTFSGVEPNALFHAETDGLILSSVSGVQKPISCSQQSNGICLLGFAASLDEGSFNDWQELLCNAQTSDLICTFPDGTPGHFTAQGAASGHQDYNLFFTPLNAGFTPIELLISSAC